MIDRIVRAIEEGWERQVGFLQAMVRTPSITGSERAVQELIASHLTGLGLTVDAWCPVSADVATHPAYSDDGLPLGDRPVVVGEWRGVGGGPSLILNGHVDVVPVGDESLWPYPPWSGTIADGRLHGRGSCDMKAGLSAAMAAVAALKRTGFQPGGNVLIQSVIGEETGGVGTLSAILRGYGADAAIVMEPTRLSIAPVGSGALSFRITVKGRAAHGGLRQEGVSAIACFLPVFTALQALETRRHARFAHPFFAPGELAAPLSIGIVRAGDWVSTVPEELVAMGRYGIFPGEDVKSARTALEHAAAEAAASDAWLVDHPPQVEWFEGQFEPGETPGDAPIIEVLSQAHRTVKGEQPEIRGVPWGSDMRLLTRYAQTPTALYGAGDVRLAHTVHESVPLDELRDLTTVLALTMLRWSG